MARRAAWLGMCVALCGCGLVIDFGAHDGATDARASADAGSDDRDAGQRVDATRPADGGASDGDVVSDGSARDGDTADAGADASTACGFYDDFEDGVTESRWTVSEDPLVPLDETGGALVIRPATDTPDAHYSSYETAEPMDLTGGWAEVRGATLTSSSDIGAEMFFQLSDRAYLVLFGYSGGRMVCRTETTGHAMRDTSLPDYDPARDVFWRIRHDGSSLVCETSPDRVTWYERARKTNVLDTRAVYFAPYAGTWRATGAPGVARYDDARAWGPALCP